MGYPELLSIITSWKVLVLSYKTDNIILMNSRKVFNIEVQSWCLNAPVGTHTGHAGEPVFGVNNPAVFLRKILGLFSMAKRQNSSMQPAMFSHSALFFVYIRFFSIYNFPPRKWIYIYLKQYTTFIFLCFLNYREVKPDSRIVGRRQEMIRGNRQRRSKRSVAP